MTEFFKDIGLSANSISGNYALKKIGELYEEVQEIENVGLYTVPIENPKTIGEDDLVMWFDPSNPLLVSVDGTGAVVNDTQGIALRDKSKYGNSLSVPAGASGITYDSEKRMLACSGNTNTSYLHTLALEPAVHWTTANSSFTYFIVIEEKRWTGGVPAVRGLLNFFYTAPVAGQQTYSGILSDTNADQWTYAPVDSMGTAVCHPNNAVFNFEYKAIIAMTYGVDAGGLPFRDLYYNGMFCGRQSNLTGLSTRNQSFILGGYDQLGTYQRYTGFIGEQCLFKRALTRTEIVRMTEYLNAKWEVFAPRECDIFCVGGQSNAVGSAGGASPTPPEFKINGTVGGYYLDPQYWYTANETPISCFRANNSGRITFYLPSDVNAPTTLTTTAPNVGGGCLWANFGDEYYKKTGRYAVFLYTPRSGSSMIGSTQWNPIAFRNGTTNYWTDVKNILSPAVLKLQTNGWEVKHKFFLWNQGENSGDRNNVNNAQLFQDAIDLVLDTFGYERFFFYIIANTTLTSQGTNYSQITQQTYTFPRPDVHMVFDCSVFTKWGSYPFPLVSPATNDYMIDDSHYSRLGYTIAGSDSGKQAGEIVNQFSTITIRDVNTTTTPTVVYPPYDVRYWGAVGNGVADDTLAIQNAINANSRCVYFPAGVYATTGPITAISKNNFKLVGDGATILRIGSGVTNQILILTSCTFCRVENLKMLQSLTAVGGGNRCIDMTDCFGCVINGCDLGGDGASSGIGPVIGVNMNTTLANAEYLQFGNTITNCNVYRCQWGIRIQGTTRNTLIQGCNFSYNNLNSVWCQTQTYFTSIVDCNFSASNVAVKVEGSGFSAVAECDRATVSGCTFKNISVCGVYCLNLKYGVNIVGCQFSVAGDNVGLGWTWSVNNPSPSNLPASARWGVFLQATRNVNITGCIFDGCTYGIGYNGAPLTNITGCTFRTDPTLSVSHIWENRVIHVFGADTYTTAQCVVSNNTFDGNYTGGFSNFLQKAIRFYTTGTNEFSTEWSIYNNTRTTGFNELTFTDSLPNGTYVIDANYDTVNIDLTIGAGKVLQISPTMFGRTFTLSAFTEDSQIGAGQLDFAFTGNYTGNQVPIIRCGGISYDSVSRTYTILRTGNYYFSNLNSSQNQWVITSDSYPITPTGVFTINYTVDTRIPKMLYISGNRKLTFPNAGTFGIFRYGFSFEFAFLSLSPVSNIDITNSTGENMIIRFTNPPSDSIFGDGSTAILSSAVAGFSIYRAVFVYNGAGTTSWIIHQM